METFIALVALILAVSLFYLFLSVYKGLREDLKEIEKKH